MEIGGQPQIMAYCFTPLCPLLSTRHRDFFMASYDGHICTYTYYQPSAPTSIFSVHPAPILSILLSVLSPEDAYLIATSSHNLSVRLIPNIPEMIPSLDLNTAPLSDIASKASGSGSYLLTLSSSWYWLPLSLLPTKVLFPILLA